MSKDKSAARSERHERRKAGPPVAEQGKGPTSTPPEHAGDEQDDASTGKGKSRLKITPLDGRDTLKYEDVADK